MFKWINRYCIVYYKYSCRFGSERRSQSFRGGRATAHMRRRPGHGGLRRRYCSGMIDSSKAKESRYNHFLGEISRRSTVHVPNDQRIGDPFVEAGAPAVHGLAPSGGRVSSVYNKPRRAGINESSFAHTSSIQSLHSMPRVLRTR